MDKVIIYTWGVFLFSMLLFYWFGRFSLRLIKQHKNFYGLLFELEEEEKKK
jgi:hypothetical protein